MRLITLITLLLAIVLLSGCTGTFQAPQSCEDGKSVILKLTAGDPSGLDRALLTANFVGLEKGVYTAQEARDFLTDVRQRIERGINYAGLYNLLKDREAAIQRRAGVALMILGPDIDLIRSEGGTRFLTACDKALILGHINHQENRVLAFY